jgi:hypothetical protein
VIGVAWAAVPAFGATSFTNPSDNPHVVTGASDGSTPFDIAVSGFTQGQQVFLELCDGAPVGTGWDPGLHCDNGTAPAAVIANGSGNASFPAADPNYQFPPAGTPLVGPSPSGLFACVGTLPNGVSNGGVDPATSLKTWNNCKVRASSNNASSTTDQVFLTLSLPGGGGGPVTPEVPFAALLPIGAIAVGGGFFLYRRRRMSHVAA